MYQFIQDQHQLNAVLEIMNQSAVYALDSEFIKVDTFWPKLGVFQINVANQVYLLDGVSLNLNPFWQKICAAKQNVFHACSEDIDLIYHYAQVNGLNNVFDTQVAMSFLGYGLQVSYQNALKHVLNIDIEKDQTRSNWLARPLTEQQMSYAANDVVYLQQLSNNLQQQLKNKQLLNFVLEDCQSLTQEIAQETPIENLYADIGNYRHSRRQLMQLQQLAVWREKLIKVLNVPKSFILKNATMIDLVEKNPKNHFQLSGIKQIRPNIIREYGKTILELLKSLPEKEQWPASISRPIKHVTPDIAARVEAHIQQVADQLSIPKDTLMRKKWLNELYHHVVFQNTVQDFSPYLKGWRFDILTRPLLNILQNDVVNLSQQMKVHN